VEFVNFFEKKTSTGQGIQTTVKNQNPAVRIIVQFGLIRQSRAATQFCCTS
jgi:hypothetical protein